MVSLYVQQEFKDIDLIFDDFNVFVIQYQVFKFAEIHPINPMTVMTLL